MTKRDYYEVLGVARNATDPEIKKAYRRAAQKHHPDRNDGDKKAEDRFKEAKEAYEILSDPTLRARYNSIGHASSARRGPSRQRGGVDLDDIIRAARASFHDASGGGGQQQFTQQIGVPLEILINGGIIDVQVMMPESTGAYGQIRLTHTMAKITIKKDTAPSTVLHETINGMDVTLVILPQSSNGFFAHGIDIVKKIDISVIDALVGVDVKFVHPDGKTIHGDVPAGVESGTPLRIKGRGFAHPMGGRGDMIVVVNHVMPVLNEEQMKIVKELSNKLK